MKRILKWEVMLKMRNKHCHSSTSLDKRMRGGRLLKPTSYSLCYLGTPVMNSSTKISRWYYLIYMLSITTILLVGISIISKRGNLKVNISKIISKFLARIKLDIYSQSSLKFNSWMRIPYFWGLFRLRTPLKTLFTC